MQNDDIFGLGQNLFQTAGELRFEARGFLNDEILAMVLSGKKTAFFASLATYAADRESLPVSGETYVVIDKADVPRCIIEIVSVNVVPFCEVTWNMAAQEAYDENLSAWQERTKEWLADEGEIVGFSFVPDLKLVFQTFRLVKIF